MFYLCFLLFCFFVSFQHRKSVPTDSLVTALIVRAVLARPTVPSAATVITAAAFVRRATQGRLVKIVCLEKTVPLSLPMVVEVSATVEVQVRVCGECACTC